MWLIVSNVFEGRWGTHDRYQQSMEALTDFMRTTNPEEVPVFLEVIIIIMIIIITTMLIIIMRMMMIIEDACGESPPHHRAHKQKAECDRVGRRERRPGR